MPARSPDSASRLPSYLLRRESGRWPRAALSNLRKAGQLRFADSGLHSPPRWWMSQAPMRCCPAVTRPASGSRAPHWPLRA